MDSVSGGTSTSDGDFSESDDAVVGSPSKSLVLSPVDALKESGAFQAKSKKGKRKRTGWVMGKRSDVKRALVTLAPDDSIDIFEV